MSAQQHVLPAVVMFLAACGGVTPAPERADEEERLPPYAVALRFEDAGTDEHETPYTAVSLVRIAPDGRRTVVALRREMGACFHEDASGTLAAARCWWAGAGARYVVRREDDAVAAARAEVDEMTGEGPLEEVGRVEVPRDAELRVLAPLPVAAHDD